jgi:hypothetical protein
MSLEVAVALSDRPRRYPHQLPARIEPLIVGCKRDRPHWGAHKIRELLVRRLDGDIRIPKSAVDAGLHRHGLAKMSGRAPLGRWSAAINSDGAERSPMRPFQGRVQARRGKYCYPLTLTNHASRYLLICKALTSTREDLVVTAFEQLFQERGPPHATRAGSGVPFANPNAPSTFPSSRYGGSGAASPSPRPYTGLPDLTYPSTTARSSSPPAAASACIASPSTSQPCSPVNASASRRSTKAFGSSVS